MRASIRLITAPGLLAWLALSVDVAVAEAPQPVPTTAAPTIKRTILRTVDVPDAAYKVVYALVEIPAHTAVGRHTHPGTVMGYLLEGDYTLLVDGEPAQAIDPGGSIEVPPGVVHDERAGDTPVRALAVFVVEKDKPLTSPAP